jgi:hypothetical protein
MIHTLLIVSKHISVLICNYNPEEIVGFCMSVEWKSNNQYRIKVNFERNLNFYHD